MTVIYFVELTLDQIARVFQGREGVIVIYQYLPATSDWLALFPNLISIQKWKQRVIAGLEFKICSETGWQNNALVTYVSKYRTAL